MGSLRRSARAALLLVGAAGACTPPETVVPTPPVPAQAAVPPPTAAGTFLLLSDIHFDPFAEASLVKRLIAADAGDWRAIFESAALTGYSGPGKDTNYPLLKSALDAAAAAAPKPDFIVLPGDFLAHHFEDNHARAMGASGDATPAAALAFAVKTLAFVALELSSRFPEPPIFPVIGNNDSGCADYSVQPSGEFLTAAARIFEPLVTRGTGQQPTLPGGSSAPGFAASFAAGGHYTAKLPIEHPTTLIAVDSVVWSSRYRTDCGSRPDAGEAELAWLRASLESARAAGSSVWIAAHIPPGIDAFKAAGSGTACPASPTAFYAPAVAPAVLGLLQANAGTITLSLGGHTHADDFRLFPGGPGAPSIPHKVAPALSPVFGNAPAFTVMSFDRATGAIRDYTVTRLQAPAHDGGVTSAVWRPEYAFDEAYHQTGFTSASLSAVADAIAAGGAARDAYASHLQGGSTNGISARAARAYACAIRNLTAESFTTCACAP